MLFTQIVSAVALALALKVDSVACEYCKHTQLYMDATCRNELGSAAGQVLGQGHEILVHKPFPQTTSSAALNLFGTLADHGFVHPNFIQLRDQTF
jgi:hypothetical protein